MKVGDKVLVLLPTEAYKLLMQWKGPFDIVERLGDIDYRVNIGGQIKTIHANLLKQYIEREDECCGAFSTCGVSLIDFDGDDDETDHNKKHILLPPAVQTETYNDVNISENVSSDQCNAIEKLCESFADVLTDLPGVTNLVEHKIEMMTNEPVQIKQYPLPFHTEKNH